MEREKIVEAMARGIAQAESCHPDDWQHFTEQAQAALTALEALGLVVVPSEPTEAMVKAAHGYRPYREDGDYDADYDANTEMTRNAMIAAALPAAPHQANNKEQKND